MIELKYGNLKTSVPGSWEELSPGQLQKAIELLSEKRDALEVQLEFIHYLLPKSLKSAMHNFTALELLELRSQFEFLLAKPCFSKFTFKTIRLPWSLTYLHGPADDFANLNVREYGTAEFFLKQYAELDGIPELKDRALEALNKFVATIFTIKKHGERFVPNGSTLFHAEMKQRSVKIASLPIAKKLAIAYNFAAVREFVFSQFDEAFSRSGAESKREKYGWDGVVQHIAASRHMVPDAIYNMNLLELLVQLDTLAIAENEREKK